MFLGTIERSIEDLAAIAAFRAAEDVPLNFWMQRLFTSLPESELRAPHSAGGMGGLATMAWAFSWYNLEPDDVVLVRYHPADAAYVSTQLTDWWFRSIDADRITSSLSRAQSVTDDDGWISLAVARQDPGIANWLDTGGLKQVMFGHRWQAFDRSGQHEAPAFSARIVKLKQLSSALPDGVRTIDAAGRRAQLEARAAGFQRRFLDH